MQAGTRIGPYEVIALLGEGGIGEVYRVHDSRLGRDVALKFLHEAFANDAASAARFDREARLVASLRHPNILVIHDVGVHDGHAFLVTELLDGETLRQRLYGPALALDVVLRFAIQIAQGLDAAHAKHIVHRDLKPENVFVLPDEQIKILDFGLAVQQEAAAGAAPDDDVRTTMRTQAGSVLGTAGYMSPEQARGLEVDARADIFAFGAILYEMATGQRAFARPSPVDSLIAVLTDDPTAPGATMRRMPEALASVVRRCLHKSPAARFQAVRDVIAELERLERPGGTVSQAVRQPSLAVLPFADISPAKDNEYFCDGISEEITGALAKLSGLRIASRTSAFQFRERTTDVRAIAAALGVEAVLEGSVRTAKDRLRIAVQLVNAADGYQLWSETYDRRLDDVFAVQEEIARTVVSALQVNLALPAAPLIATAPADLRAYPLYLRGRHHWNRRTEEGFRRAVALFRDAIAIDPGYAQAYVGLAEAELALGLYGIEPSGDAMPAARASARRAMELSTGHAHAHAVLACVQAVHDWNWSEAEATFGEAIALDPLDAAAHHWLAINTLVPLGRFHDAETALARAIAIDPLSLVFNTTAGMLAYFAGDFSRAATRLNATLDLDQTFVLAQLFLGLTYAETGAYEQALDHLRTAARLSDGSPEIRAALAFALARAGQANAAREEIGALLTLSATRYLSPSLIAQVYAGLGETRAALDALEDAHRLRAADLAWVAVRPVYADIRGEPRFGAIVDAMGLSVSGL